MLDVGLRVFVSVADPDLSGPYLLPDPKFYPSIRIQILPIVKCLKVPLHSLRYKDSSVHLQGTVHHHLLGTLEVHLHLQGTVHLRYSYGGEVQPHLLGTPTPTRNNYTCTSTRYMCTCTTTRYIYTYEVYLHLRGTPYKYDLRRYENMTSAPTSVMFR
jgi:hypothetical protein